MVVDTSPLAIGLKSYDDAFSSRQVSYLFQKEQINAIKEQIIKSNNSMIKVLIYLNDEINKNLFIKYLQIHKI